MDFDQAYCRLIEAEPSRARKVLRVISDEFGESLLTFAPMSDGHVDFVCRILSDPTLAKRPGLEWLLMEFYLEREKLSEPQLERFFACLDASFGHLSDEKVAFAVGDFIARVAPAIRALTLLSEMAMKVNSRDALAGVYLGLDILRKHRATNGLSLAKIEAVDRTADARAAALKPL
ncbi:hypothetical protein [Bradyrhizobium oligotrophicum]|nr:hypothetical protein [Bradyrhizobium oligotrophicum]